MFLFKFIVPVWKHIFSITGKAWIHLNRQKENIRVRDAMTLHVCQVKVCGLKDEGVRLFLNVCIKGGWNTRFSVV